MLRYLLFVNVALATLAASMAISVGISALLLGWHLDMAPQYGGMMMALIKLTAAYTLVMLAGAGAAFGIFRKRNWHWSFQGVFVLSLVFAWQYSILMITT